MDVTAALNGMPAIEFPDQHGIVTGPASCDGPGLVHCVHLPRFTS